MELARPSVFHRWPWPHSDRFGDAWSDPHRHTLDTIVTEEGASPKYFPVASCWVVVLLAARQLRHISDLWEF